MMEWNKIKDKIPDRVGIYLCATITAGGKGDFVRDMEILYYSGEGMWDADGVSIVTHWMEIPELPEEVF